MQPSPYLYENVFPLLLLLYTVCCIFVLSAAGKISRRFNMKKMSSGQESGFHCPEEFFNVENWDLETGSFIQDFATAKWFNLLKRAQGNDYLCRFVLIKAFGWNTSLQGLKESSTTKFQTTSKFGSQTTNAVTTKRITTTTNTVTTKRITTTEMTTIATKTLPITTTERTTTQSPATSRPTVLSWNDFFSAGKVIDRMLKNNNITECPFLCTYSTDHDLEQNASIIIFHARDTFTTLPTHRNPNQLYAFFLMESPINSENVYKTEVPRDFFNISITYRADSDVIYPYDAFDEFNAEVDDVIDRWTEEEKLTKVAAKSRLVLQLVSNCYTNSRRELYTGELQRHMDITMVGRCSRSESCDNECADKLLDSHFFYLAFENSVCNGYVTEKFWHIKKLIVPIVLSRRVFTNLKIPQDAFIAADDFGSAKELAAHLKMVAADRDRYMNYLKWTDRFKRSKHGNDVQFNPLCQVCRLAHNQPMKIIKDIVQFWDDGGQCQDRFAENLLN